MRLTGNFITCACFLLAIVFLSFAAAKAQTAASYQFLEVVDSKGKPVAGATVETFGFQAEQRYKTDEKGRVEKMEIIYGDYNTLGFTVSKAGYYPFRYEFGRRHSTEKPIRIELLEIPETEAERKIVENEQRKREFFEAARKADVEAVRKFLKMGLSPNLTTSDLRGIPLEKNVPIIIYAAQTGDSETVNEFLKAGIDVSKIPAILPTYLSALPFARSFPKSESERRALQKAYEDTAESLIKAGADVRALGKYGETTLMHPAQRGLFRTTRFLIEKGVAVNARDNYGETALMRVVTNSQDLKVRFEMADLLLKSGADINLVTKFYDSCRTALMSAAWNSDVEMVKYLLAKRADVNTACENGDTALKLMKNRSVWDTSDKIREIIELLEAAGAK